MPPTRPPPLVCLLVAVTATVATAAAAAEPATAPADERDRRGQSQADAEPSSAVELDRVRVFGTARPRATLPGSVDALDAADLRDGQRRVHLSEALQRVPGFSGFDRNNHAQDLQIQSRGFGARSTFGIRGIRLIADGIPASAADGQGQAATFPLDTLDRIDVLRAPLALQYGNASGGAIVGESVLDGLPAHAVDAWIGSDGSRRLALRTDGGARDWRWRASASAFRTDGFRPQSAAERRHVNAIAEWAPTSTGRLRVVLNRLDQPLAQDPLGLDRASFERDPDGTVSAALAFDTRKRTRERQLGLDWRDEREDLSWWLGAWRTRREVLQFLAIPLAAQRAPTSAGGVIDLARDSSGLTIGLHRAWAQGALTLGMDAVRLDEDRRGYENYIGASTAPRLGLRGALRRDERNRVDTLDAHALGDIRWGQGWTALGGVRRSWLRFRSEDRYVVPGNGDDGGGVRHARSAGSLGLLRAWPQGEMFAAWGRGFETPTLNETAYRPDGTAGFHFELRPARTDSFESGFRWRFPTGERSGAMAPAHRLALTVYRIDGRDEIVPATNSGGRSSFVNAGRTRREGVELSLDGPLGGGWRYAFAASAIDARVRSGYRFITGGIVRNVRAGSRVPGIPRSDAFAEVAWSADDGRWHAALEGRTVGAIAVDDANSDRADGYARFALRGEWRSQANDGGFRVSAFARIDNLFGRRHVGSVIVNEANARYFEPATGRTWTLGMKAEW